MSFNVRRKPETPRDVKPSFDLGLVGCLEDELDECLGYISLRDYLFAVVRTELPKLREQKLDGRAVDYAQGRVYWQLGLSPRRPPRGWREGLGSRTLGETTYLALDDLSARALDCWARVSMAIDPSLAGEALLEGHQEDKLRRALHEIRRATRPGERSRLSALAV